MFIIIAKIDISIYMYLLIHILRVANIYNNPVMTCVTNRVTNRWWRRIYVRKTFLPNEIHDDTKEK